MKEKYLKMYDDLIKHRLLIEQDINKIEQAQLSKPCFKSIIDIRDLKILRGQLLIYRDKLGEIINILRTYEEE